MLWPTLGSRTAEEQDRTINASAYRIVSYILFNWFIGLSPAMVDMGDGGADMLIAADKPMY